MRAWDFPTAKKYFPGPPFNSRAELEKRERERARYRGARGGVTLLNMQYTPPHHHHHHDHHHHQQHFLLAGCCSLFLPVISVSAGNTKISVETGLIPRLNNLNKPRSYRRDCDKEKKSGGVRGVEECPCI
jgi:hypothetical protein